MQRPSSDVYKLNKVSHSWEAIGHTQSARHSATAGIYIVQLIKYAIGGMDDKEQYTNTQYGLDHVNPSCK